MKSIRIFGLALAAMLAVSVSVAAVASAAGPTFKGTIPNKFTTKSGAGQLESNSGERIACTGDEGTGEIVSETEVKKVVVKFTGCTGKKGEATCNVNSPGAGTGNIVINTTKGELGEVAASEATSKTGLYFTPETGTTFVTTEGECITEAPVKGSLVGEVTPTGKPSQKTGKVIFRGKAGVQSIKKITIKGANKNAALTAFLGIVGVSENTEESVEFTNAVEVV
jgi:hypothetical protein